MFATCCRRCRCSRYVFFIHSFTKLVWKEDDGTKLLCRAIRKVASQLEWDLRMLQKARQSLNHKDIRTKCGQNWEDTFKNHPDDGNFHFIFFLFVYHRQFFGVYVLYVYLLDEYAIRFLVKILFLQWRAFEMYHHQNNVNEMTANDVLLPREYTHIHILKKMLFHINKWSHNFRIPSS